MSVLAVIPCLNEADHLEALLRQMLRDTTITRLVVADGGSTDASPAIVERLAASDPRLVLLANPDRIQSAGVNRAVARYGEGMDWLVRIDAHCLYPDGYVGILLASAAANGADAVVVPMATEGERGWQKAIAAAQNSVLGTGGSPHRHLGSGRFVDHGHHALMRVSAFRELGGYCETMPCNEDAELDVRQTGRGLRIWLEPAAALTYFPRRSLGALWRQYWRYGAGRARTVKRHGIAMKPRQLAPVAIALAVAALPLALVHWIFAVPAAVWASACLGVGLLVGMRAGAGMALLSGVAAMVMHASWGGGFLREWLGRGTDVPRYGLASAITGQTRA
ncbi:glycosyltransferase family 2 protein [Aurantiacibacter xanthus]|uniref:Glycosyltransferase family 2 protein n=2 Tax=Aurantiacibacter xanthus TaxID=1784712 RepID=A0A3A1P9Z9_9SPHN|nr:glycosyltransferase family 2 protein [Aurantiacibacter xanthus]